VPVEKLFPANLPSAVEGLPPVVVATGRRTYYFTGQTALDANGELVGDTIEEQALQVFRILEATAAAVGVTFADVAQIRFHIVADDFQAGLEQVGAAAVRYAGGGGSFIGEQPAATMVAVSSLHLGALIEVDMIAVLD
jgi:enamine deaminase RidA (YjgF/YER057c/UK114 family)